MRWLPLALVTLVVVGVLVLQDPGAVGLGGGRTGAEAAVLPRERVGPCRLRQVIDGDTLDLRCQDRDERVRLLRIDTPEREEPGYAEARRALGGLVRGRRLFLVFEEADRPLRDRYGRLLAYVYAEDLNTSLEMVRGGWSAVDRRFGAGRFALALEAAEQEARADARGLWAGARDAAALAHGAGRPCALPGDPLPLGMHWIDREEAT